MVFCARMGTQVPRALISTLLIAGVFYAPFAPLANAQEVASTTEATVATTTVSAIVATTTQENVSAEATTTVQAPATVPDPGPSFVDSIVSHPNHVLRASNFSEQQTALKDGDVVDIAAVVTGAFPASSVTVDTTGLDGSSILNLSCDPSYTNTSYPHPLQYCRGRTVTVNTGGRIGSTSVTFTATDEAGLTVTKSVDIVLDQLSPVFSNPTLTRTSTSTFSRDETLHFSGTLNGTGSGAKIYSILGEGLSADGSTILYGSYYNWNHPLLSDVYAIRAGAFSNVSFPLSGASSGADIPSDVASMRFVFTIEDDAGHVSYATSTVSATSTTPSGPQVSNVLFLPGIKGSRLYSSETRCIALLCDNKLWDPGNDEDIHDLYLDHAGKSNRYDVHVRENDIIDRVGVDIVHKKFYSSFISQMNELQASSTFNNGNFKWKPVAYDWRLSLDDLVANGIERDGRIYYQEASSTPYIEQTLKQLAATSTTGKVTLVAHSNGGLVVKALLAKLGPEETARLVDKIIFVGVPQTGAPQALGGLLFGNREGLPFDLLPAIATPAAARGLAENSPMAYHLMPSHRYLYDTQDPSRAIISFSGSVLYPMERAIYGTTIDTITELDNFLLANERGRAKPSPDDVNTANILNSTLINYANTTHTNLDTWTPPASVSLYQIAGWGTNTISGVDFYDEQKVIGVTIDHKRQYRLSLVEDGDGVVTIPSALMMGTSSPNVNRYWIDFVKARELTGKKYDHANMLELPELIDFLEGRLLGNEYIPKFIVTQQPKEIDPKKKLIFQLHSPLTLGIFDENGKHTGLNVDGSVDENIPGAEYGEFGDVKYLIVPAGQPYRLVMHGQSNGSFSLDIQEQTGNTVTASATLADLPTTASTIARLSIKDGIADASSLQVDSDGNGSTDITVIPLKGQTVNYVSAQTVHTSPSSRSSPSVQITNLKPVSNQVIGPLVFTTPIMKSVALPSQATIINDPGSVQSASNLEESIPTSSLTQTASAYNGFISVAKWLNSLMYNIWTVILDLINHFLRPL